MIKETNELKLVDRGLNLTAGFPDITPDVASDEVKSVYEDIRQTLRVPVVNLLFRTLATYPGYLIPAWQQLSSAFRTRAFERFADDIRRIAVPEQQWNQTGEYWDDYDDIRDIRAFNDTFHYVLPKLLLVANAFYQATFGPGETTTNEASETVPKGIADGTHEVKLVESGKADKKVKTIFADIRKQHKHPFDSSYYRGLANWPDFLETAWEKIEMVVGSATYVDQKEKITEKAKAGMHLFSLTKISTATLDAEQVEVVKSILTAFRLKYIPEMLLDVALVKVLLDGEEAAKHSKFSMAGG